MEPDGGRSVRLLDPHTVNQIAAGEVVERPGAVVKELIENALDAGARRIEIEMRDAGRELIRVSDDGIGMSAEDALSAMGRHATSKIAALDDLRRVRTLGFRGEALPSIASVSRLVLSTAVADGARAAIEVDHGRVLPPRWAAGPKGTEVRVEELFANTPARRKFLKSDATEVGVALDHAMRYAAANPAVAIRMEHNGQEALASPGDGDPANAAAAIWGRDLARALVPIESEFGGIRLRGFVSPPHVTKPTRAFQYVFVNGRPVRTRGITAALDVAFRDLTPDRRFPIVLLLIEIEPERVDVNVSPTKSEVKFQQEGLAFDAIRHALKEALGRSGMMPSVAQVAAVRMAQAAALPVSSPVQNDWRPKWLPVPAGALLEAQAPLGAAVSDGPGEALPFARLLDGLRIIGQAMAAFIVAETDHGLALVDQHVAHERVIYEQLCGGRGRMPIERQRLLAPATLELDRRAHLALVESLVEVEALGFELEPFGGEAWVVRGAPAALGRRDPVRALREIAEELAEGGEHGRLVPARERIWITTSCKMAVKAGEAMSPTEMERLIRLLAETDNPYLCPHGRPITVTLTTDDLLRLFKRK